MFKESLLEVWKALQTSLESFNDCELRCKIASEFRVDRVYKQDEIAALVATDRAVYLRPVVHLIVQNR